MRIGIDADPVGRDGSGNETYLRGLISSMGDHAPPDQELLLFGSNPAALEQMCVRSATVFGRPGGLRGEISLGTSMRRNRADVALAHYNLPLAFSRPTATIVHDVSFLRLPDTFERAQRLRLTLSIKRSVHNSDAVITVSEFSKREILDCYPRTDPQKVLVAPNASDAAYFAEPAEKELEDVKKKYGLPSEFVLCVGNVQPRKNLARAAEAASRCGVPVLAAGQVHGKKLEGPIGSVRFIGYVPAADLGVLYRLCSVFCYVSLYEGFGLPVLEALASGAVVVTSETAAMTEVAGGAALLADPLSVDSITEALGVALHDESTRSRLHEEGPDRARSYSWDDSAKRVLERLRQLCP